MNRHYLHINITYTSVEFNIYILRVEEYEYVWFNALISRTALAAN